MPVVGIDVGGTNVEVGLVGDDHEVLERGKENTPEEGPEAVLDAIAELVEGLAGEPSACSGSEWPARRRRRATSSGPGSGPASEAG